MRVDISAGVEKADAHAHMDGAHGAVNVAGAPEGSAVVFVAGRRARLGFVDFRNVVHEGEVYNIARRTALQRASGARWKLPLSWWSAGEVRVHSSRRGGIGDPLAVSPGMREWDASDCRLASLRSGFRSLLVRGALVRASRRRGGPAARASPRGRPLPRAGRARGGSPQFHPHRGARERWQV